MSCQKMGAKKYSFNNKNIFGKPKKGGRRDFLAHCDYIYSEFGLDMSIQPGDKNSEVLEVPVSGGRYR